LKEYENTTGHDLQSHPFATELGQCDSPEAILQIYQNQASTLDQTGKSNQTLMKWLDPTVNLLCLFVATLGEGIALVSLSEVVFPFITHTHFISVISSWKSNIHWNRCPSRCKFLSHVHYHLFLVTPYLSDC
jgi:hypothetical protein